MKNRKLLGGLLLFILILVGASFVYQGGIMRGPLIADGITGTLFAPDDPAACAAALADLLDARSVWEDRRATARIYVETRHNWAVNVQRYQDVYQKQLPAEHIRRSAAIAQGQ